MRLLQSTKDDDGNEHDYPEEVSKKRDEIVETPKIMLYVLDLMVISLFVMSIFGVIAFRVMFATS